MTRKPQHVTISALDVSQGKTKQIETSVRPDKLKYTGVLVTSGNMLETGKNGSKRIQVSLLIWATDKNADTLKMNEHTTPHHRRH